MYPLVLHTPKCLLTIGGETILERQLRILRGFDIEDITVVTGFYHEKIVEMYGEQVSIRYNPHYEITGNIFSLWVARNLLDSGVLIMNSDIVCTYKPIRQLLENKDTYCLVVDKKIAREDERKVMILDNVVVDTSMTMPLGKASGEAIGIAKIKKSGLNLFKEALFESVKKDSHLGWLDAFANLAKKGEDISYVLIDDQWIEIDTKDDYERAKEMFK